MSEQSLSNGDVASKEIEQDEVGAWGAITYVPVRQNFSV